MRARFVSTATPDLRPAARASRLGLPSLHSTVTVTNLLASFVILLLIVLFAWLRELRLQHRPRLLDQILNLADALERQLLECRARLREIAALAAALPPADQSSACATLAAEPQVQDALRDLLAHRLWLKENTGSASLSELQSARDALAATRSTLAGQLARLADVRTEFEQSRTQAR